MIIRTRTALGPALAAALLLASAVSAPAQNADALLMKGEEFYGKRGVDAAWAARAAEIWAEGEKDHADNPEFIERQARAWHYVAHFGADARTRAAAASRGASAAARLAGTPARAAAAAYWSGVFEFEAVDNRDSLNVLSRLAAIRARLESARKADPKYEYGGPDRYLGRLYLEPPLRDPSAAVGHLESARDIAPSYSPNLLTLADAYREAGRVKEARSAYEAVLRLTASTGYEAVLDRDQKAARERLQGLAS